MRPNDGGGEGGGGDYIALLLRLSWGARVGIFKSVVPAGGREGGRAVERPSALFEFRKGLEAGACGSAAAEYPYMGYGWGETGC
jgi:hypothetical protein